MTEQPQPSINPEINPEPETPQDIETAYPPVAAVPPIEDPIGTLEGEGGPPLPHPEAPATPPTLTVVPPLEDPIGALEGEGGPPLPHPEDKPA